MLAAKWKVFQEKILQMDTFWDIVDMNLEHLEKNVSLFQTLVSNREHFETGSNNNNNTVLNNVNDNIVGASTLQMNNKDIQSQRAKEIVDRIAPLIEAFYEFSKVIPHSKLAERYQKLQILDISLLSCHGLFFSKILSELKLFGNKFCRFFRLIDRHQALIRSLVKLFPDLLLGPFEFVLENIR
jgi:hypothetical protein